MASAAPPGCGGALCGGWPGLSSLLGQGGQEGPALSNLLGQGGQEWPGLAHLP